MNFIEFIAFIITMLAFFFLIVKQANDERKRKSRVDRADDESLDQGEEIKGLLQTIESAVSEKRSSPPSVRRKETFVSQPRKTGRKRVKTRSLAVLERSYSLKDAIILKEILDHPRHVKERREIF